MNVIELQPRVAVLKAPGINCDDETAKGFELAGARPEIVMVEDLKAGEKSIKDFQIIALSGGFSYADGLGSGKIMALELDSALGNQLERHKETGLMIGICNGFQVLVRSGLLPFGEMGKQQATLDRNDSGKFISRRIDVVPSEITNCVFLKDLKPGGSFEFQVAHGEGKFITSTENLNRMEAAGQVTFRYTDRFRNPTQNYPDNPNGSPNAVAGITDPTGTILGLMPHPERSILRTQYQNWRRMPPDSKPQGLIIFENMVNYVKQAT